MRYAIYYVPPADDMLYRLGSDWLGHDVYNRGFRDKLPAYLEAHTEIREQARSYGFHATLKAPFHLAANTSEQELIDDINLLASRTPGFEIPALKLDLVRNFFALVPEAPSAQLEHLASSCVRHLDRFRLALSKSEVERREPAGLNSRQRDYLYRWGYPYVLDEFIFHLTLTDELSTDQQGQYGEMLARAFAPVVGKPLEVGQIALMQQPDTDQPFTLVSQHSLL